MIQCLPIGQNVFSDMSQTGLTLKAQNESELFILVDKLLNNKAFYEQTIYASAKALDFYFYNLGHSLEKIAELLKLDEHSPKT